MLQQRAREVVAQAVADGRLAQVLQCMSLRPLPAVPDGSPRERAAAPGSHVRPALGRLNPKHMLAGRLDGRRASIAGGAVVAGVTDKSATGSEDDLQRMLHAFGKWVRIGVIGANEHTLGTDGRLQALVQVVAQQVSDAVGHSVIFLTEGRPGVQEMFVRRCVRGTRIRNLVAEGERSFFQRGLPVTAGSTMEERRKIFVAAGDLYFLFGSSPESAITVEEVSFRGVPLFAFSPPSLQFGAKRALAYNPGATEAHLSARAPPFVFEAQWATFRQHVLELVAPSVVADDATGLLQDFLKGFVEESRAESEAYDVVVIGGGKAGRRTALALRSMGLTVAISESPEEFQRLSPRSHMQCLREAVHGLLQQAAEGGDAGELQAAAALDKMRDAFKRASAERLATRSRSMKAAGISWLTGRGEVERVGTDRTHPYLVSVRLLEHELPTWRVRCKSVVLATGSSPIWPWAQRGSDDDFGIYTHDHSWPAGAFDPSFLGELSYLPVQVVVQGSPSGVGYALLLAKLGARVTLAYDSPTFDEDNSCPICEDTMDQWLQEALKRAMTHAGIEVLCNSAVESVAPWPDQQRVAAGNGAGLGMARVGRAVPSLQVNIQGVCVESDCFIASNCIRKGNIGDDWLERLGVRISSSCLVEVENEVGFTGVTGVYAVGGVTSGEADDMAAMDQCNSVAAAISSDLDGSDCDDGALSLATLPPERPPNHESEAKMRLTQAPFENSAGLFGSLRPTVVETLPEFAWVGISQQLADAEGIQIMVGKASYSNAEQHGAAGLLKLVFDAGTGGLVGVHAVGEGAGGVASFGARWMQQDATALELAQAPQSSDSPSCAKAFQQAAQEAISNQ